MKEQGRDLVHSVDIYPGVLTSTDQSTSVPVDPFSFQQNPHDWCIKSYGMCISVFRKVFIKSRLCS